MTYHSQGQFRLASMSPFRLDFDDLDKSARIIENSLKPLRPGHRCPAFCGCWVLPLISPLALFTFASPCWRHLHAMLAVGRKDTVKPSEVDSGFGHQRRQSGDEVQRLEDHMGSAVPIGGF